jgi:hypothetical protein
MNAKEMASLFDVDLDNALESTESSDYGTTVIGDSLQPFEKRVEDARAILEPDGSVNETDIITQAREKAKKSPPQRVIKEIEPEIEPEIDDCAVSNDDMEIPGDVLKEVDEDISRAAAETEALLKESQTTESKIETPIEPEALSSDDNPLELSGEYLKFYTAIREKYPQFVLYDGSRAYKGFYTYKVMVLSNILREFPILDIDDMFNELSEINLRQFVNSDEVTPDIVRLRIDDVYRQKVRLADILMQCYHQFFVWEREVEMLKSKLWKDHELRGSHRRDGLTLEHLFDLEQYYNRLKGFLEAAKVADATLRAASDSLSRQLTCLQMKEQMNLPSHAYASPAEPVHEVVATPKPRVQKSHAEPDVIFSGSVITAPQAGCAAQPVDFGVDQSDDIAALG